MSRYNRDFLFSVELLVELGIFISYFLDIHKSLVLCQHLYEPNGDRIEVSHFLETFVEFFDFSDTHTGIFSELFEAF